MQLLTLNLVYTIWTLQYMQSRGPNTLNLNSYTRGPEKASSQSPYNQTENISVEEKFDIHVKQIKQHQDLMTKMSKNISMMTNDNDYFSDFYPDYALNCKYEKDEQKKVVSYSDVSLNKVLSALEKTNSTIKEEIKGWNFQFAKKTRLTQSLISQNKIVRRYLSKKNKQIVDLLQHIKRTENNELVVLQEKLNELKEENNILADHYKKIKQDLADKNNEQIQLSKAIDSANLKNIELEGKMQEIQDREQHVGKFRTMGVQNQKQYASRQKYLLGEKDRLKQLKEQYKKDEMDIMEQINQCHQEKQQLQTNIQPKFQTYIKQKNDLLNGIQQNSEAYIQQLEKNKQLKEENMRNEQKLSEYSTMGRKIDRKLNQYQKILNERQNQRSSLVKQEGAMLADMDMLDMQIGELNQQLERKKKNLDQLTKHKQEQIKTLKTLRQDEVNRWNKQLEICKKACNKRMMQQNHQIELQTKQIANLHRQIKQINGYIQSLFEQIRQNKQKEAVANQLRNRLNAVQSQMRR